MFEERYIVYACEFCLILGDIIRDIIGCRIYDTPGELVTIHFQTKT
jgi:hypothetical protein